MRTTLLRSLAATALCGLVSAPLEAQQVNKEQLEGIRNLSRIESTVACAGAITPAAVAGIKEMGYGAIINLRLATEQGADIEGHMASAQGRRHPLHPRPVQRHDSGARRRRRVPAGHGLAGGRARLHPLSGRW